MMILWSGAILPGPAGLTEPAKSEGAAPDGEEYFTMALFFASHRWGDGEGIYNYSKEACTILRDCIHKGEQPGTGHPMWDPGTKLIKFVANCNFTDASYHLPHFL